MRLSGVLLLGLSLGVVAGCHKEEAPEPTGPKTAGLGMPPKDGGDVVYKQTSSGNLTMTVVKPKKDVDLHLAVVLIHGGGWVGGSRSEMVDIGKYLNAKGFTTFNCDYRLAPKDLWPAQIQDVEDAVRYVRFHDKDFGIKGNKIAAVGISAGGHLSSILGLSKSLVSKPGLVPAQVQAVGSISGIHDLNAPLTKEGETYHIVQKALGEKGAPDKDARAKASPITYYDAKTSPTFFIQGKADPLVPAEQTSAAVAKLKRVGVPTDSVLVDGMGHGLSPNDPKQAAALDKLCDWLIKYLK